MFWIFKDIKEIKECTKKIQEGKRKMKELEQKLVELEKPKFKVGDKFQAAFEKLVITDIQPRQNLKNFFRNNEEDGDALYYVVESIDRPHDTPPPIGKDLFENMVSLNHISKI